MIRSAVPARILSGLALLALAGCARRADRVATVGREPITVAEFTEAARSGNPDYPGAPGAGRALLLNDLIRRKLLVMEARKRHLVPDSTITRLRRETADRYAVEALVQRLVPMPAVSEAEVDEFYRRRGIEARMRAIYTPDEHAAADAAAQIRKGADFGELADRLNLPGMVPKGGDLGYLIPGSLVSPLDQVLREAPVGKVIGPLEAPGQGWFVLRIDGRRPRRQDPLDAQRASLREMLRQRKQRELQQRAYVEIRDQYRVRLEPGGSQAMFARFNSNEQNLVKGMGAEPPNPAQHLNDRSVILARYDGPRGEPATYTLANAIEDMNAPGRQRPEVTSVPMMDHWIENQVVQKAITTEARRRHIDEEPALAARVEQQIDNMLLQAIYDREISSRVTTATDAEIRASYDRHASSFLRLSSAHVLVATTPDSNLAVKLVDAATASGDLHAAAKSVGLTAVEREEKFPSKDPVWIEMQAVLLGLVPKQLHGPVHTRDGGWMVFQLLAKDQGIQTYDDLPAPFKEQLKSEALDVERDRRLTQLTDSLRTVIPVRVDQARLDHIPWPVPPATPAS